MGLDQSNGDVCVIISPGWPGQPSGYGVAGDGLLRTALDHFRQIEYISVVANDWKGHEKDFEREPVRFYEVAADASPKWLRFAKSTCGRVPASVVRYTVPGLVPCLSEVIERISPEAAKKVLLIQDVLLGFLLIEEKRLLEAFDVRIVRSENVHSNAFRGFLQKGNFISRFCWHWEIKQLEQFEQAVLEAADVVWTISEEDKAYYESHFGIPVAGVAGVHVNTENYRNVTPGDRNRIIYLGSFDIRKSSSVSQFIELCWQDLRGRNPRVELILGGKGSEAFDDPENGIHGVGFVDDESDFLSSGAIFINPQESGSGVKLKSITAMVAGKVLISTGIGIEGIPASPRAHFLGGGEVAEFTDLISTAWDNWDESLKIAEAGREFAVNSYSLENLKADMTTLFAEI